MIFRALSSIHRRWLCLSNTECHYSFIRHLQCQYNGHCLGRTSCHGQFLCLSNRFNTICRYHKRRDTMSNSQFTEILGCSSMARKKMKGPQSISTCHFNALHLTESPTRRYSVSQDRHQQRFVVTKASVDSLLTRLMDSSTPSLIKIRPCSMIIK